MGTLRGHPVLFLSREKIRKNKIFKNNKLKTGPLFRKTSPSESVHGFLFNFDESLSNHDAGHRDLISPDGTITKRWFLLFYN